MAMKSTLIAAAIGVALASGGYAATHLADARYVQQQTFKQSVDQQRIWTLEDRATQIRSKANSEGRGLTTYEQAQIKTISEQVKSLRGW
jgi:hypothetical protein